MKASAFKAPVLPKEAVTLPDGSEVHVRALKLTERLAVRRQVAVLTEGKGVEESLTLMVPRLLAMAVVDEDGKPLLDADGWDEYGASHPAAVLDLFNKASDLSGFSSEAAEKNS